MDKVIITGANGFIGSHIVERFVMSGVKTACLVRKESGLSNVDCSKIEIRYGDVRDEAGLIKAFNGFNFVIHNAARTADWGGYQSFYKTNVEGSRNVLKACLKNEINNIIMTGSISSYGEENCREVKDENCAFNSHYNYFLDKIFPCKLNYYRDTKALATKESIKFAKENGLNLTILEPAWVYGEREFNTGFYEYIKSAKNGMIFSPGSKKNKFHVIYAGDLARAYFLAYNKKLKGVNRIIVGNKQAELMDKIFTIFCKEAQVKKPMTLPKWLLYPVGFFTELAYTVFNSNKPPLLTRGRVNMFYDNIEYSAAKAKKLLGFVNEYSLEEGIKRTVGWYRDKGFV